MQFPKKRTSEIFRKGDDGPLHITEEGVAQLREKLVELERSLPHLASEAQRTADYGDRSENAEYKDAKLNLRRARGQILNIQYKLKRAVLIPAGPNALGTVQIGSTVVLETGEKQKVFQIVGSHETDPSKGRISYQSPLGAALINHKQGDAVMLESPSGSRTYHILEVK
jgi:transcription elongation GreA/GreB family factor